MSELVQLKPESNSISDLLDELCKSLYNDVVTAAPKSMQIVSAASRNDRTRMINPKLLKKCKLRAYEILLKKSDSKLNSGHEDDDILWDPVKEFKFAQFEYDLYVGDMQSKFHAYGHVRNEEKLMILKRKAMFEDCLDFIRNDPYFCVDGGQGEGHAILQLLVRLKNFGRYNKLNEEKLNNSFFNGNSMAILNFALPEPKYFQLNLVHYDQQQQQNPYLSRNLIGLPGLFTFPDFKKNKNFDDRFSLRRSIIEEPQQLRLKPFSRAQHPPQSSLNSSNSSQKPKSTKSSIFYVSHKWEHLGRKFTFDDPNSKSIMDELKEKSFITEHPESVLNLSAAKAIVDHELFQARLVPLSQFLAHVKSLLIGIESDSFYFIEATTSFVMVEHLTIANVSPATIVGFVQDFLECGTCYKRLKMIIGRNVYNFKLKYNGFLFKALCSSLDKYLETFRRLVIFAKDRSIVELALRVAPMIKQIRILSRILAIHPNGSDEEIPRGSEFLGYLYKQIIDATLKDVSLLLVFILSECCDIYFRNFENWIFHGVIDDPCKELFIEFINHYRPRTKFYFDKAHIIKKQAVPGFLQGYENSILLCGKYANLLKLYNPTHPLLSLTPPSISICLSFNQLQAAETKCNEYKRLAQATCGPIISISDIFREKDEQLKSMAQKFCIKFQQDLEKWRSERETREADAREQKEKQRLILLDQIQESREQKIQKRREQLRLDQEYMRHSEQVEMELLARENAERQKTVDYYKELGEIVDEQRKRAEAEMEELQKQLKSDNAKLNRKDDVEPMAQSLDEFPKDDDSEVNVTVYFDASSSPGESDKSHEKVLSDPDSPVCNENYKRSIQPVTDTEPVVQLPATEHLAELRKNREVVLTSNIHLTADGSDLGNRPNLTSELSEAQRNRLKILQQEYDFRCSAETGPSAKTILTESSTNELTELQRNRQKILAHEYAYDTAAVVAIPENKTMSELEVNRRAAQNHDYNFNELPTIALSRPTVETVALTDLQKNRLKVMGQEYNIVQSTSCDQPLSKNARNKLKSSLSLELEDQSNKPKMNENESGQKQGQSTFDNTPMSTTSDEIIGDMASSQIGVTSGHRLEKPSEKGDAGPEKSRVTGHEASSDDPAMKNGLKLDTDLAKMAGQDSPLQSASTAAVQPTPESALNTAGLMSKQYGFLFDRSPTRNHSISQIIRPTFSMTNFFDISSQLTPTTSSFSIGRKTYPKSEMPSMTELRHLNIANLTNFLQQSFVLPLQAHLSVLNNEILKIYLKDFDILSHFQSLRNYFFMMDGEFASNISEGLLTKLHTVRKPNELLNSHVLHSILENALHSSIIGNDKNAENLSFFIPNVPEQFDMASPNVLKELHLSYKVEWPLNLLLSVETIEHYGFVFQHLIKLRRISWLLEQCFYKLKDIRKQSAELIQKSAQYRHIQQIRHKLSCFVNSLQTHITSVAIQGSWQWFQQELETVKSMDDLYKKHTKYLKRVEFLCMLNKKSYDFYMKMEDIFVVVLRFCYNLQSRNWRCDDSGNYTHPKYQKLLQIENDFNKLIKFIIYAGQKMFQRGYQTEIGEFIYMLNMNGYYDGVEVTASENNSEKIG